MTEPAQTKSVEELRLEALAQGTDGAAKRFLESLRIKTVPKTINRNLDRAEAISELNLTAEEREKAAKKRQELEEALIDENAQPVNVEGMDKRPDMSGGPMRALQGFYDSRRPECFKLYTVDMMNVREQKRKDGVPGWDTQERLAECQVMRSAVKLRFTMPAKSKGVPINESERQVWENYSRALSPQALHRVSEVTHHMVERIVSARVRQMVIPPTELWAPPLLSLLSGPDFEKDVVATMDAKGQITMPENMPAVSDHNERPGVIGAPYMVRYLSLVIEICKQGVEQHYQRETDPKLKGIIQLQSEVAARTFAQVDKVRAETMQESIKSCREAVFKDIKDPITNKGIIPAFWDVYGTWKTEEQLLGASKEAFARMSEEQRLELTKRAAVLVYRRNALEHLALEMHNTAGLICTELVVGAQQFLGIESGLMTLYGQSRIPLPERPKSDRLRAPNGLSHTWGLDNLKAYVRWSMDHPGMRAAAIAKGLELEHLFNALEDNRAIIIGTSDEYPREERVSGGALTIGYCYYAFVTELILGECKKHYMAELAKAPRAWECALCYTLNPPQAACGGCALPKIEKPMAKNK
jgi:hypothetical protein